MDHLGMKQLTITNLIGTHLEANATSKQDPNSQCYDQRSMKETKAKQDVARFRNAVGMILSPKENEREEKTESNIAMQYELKIGKNTND